MTLNYQNYQFTHFYKFEKIIGLIIHLKMIHIQPFSVTHQNKPKLLGLAAVLAWLVVL